MTLGQRIEARRLELGISQAELARRVGVRQSTMHSLITGNSRTSRSLLQIARELKTTPAYLTGETDDPNADVPDQAALTGEEQEWIGLFRVLASEEQGAALVLLRALAARPAGETLHDRQHGYRDGR